MLELLASLLILILAVALVRRLLGIERGGWGLTLLAWWWGKRVRRWS